MDENQENVMGVFLDIMKKYGVDADSVGVSIGDNVIDGTCEFESDVVVIRLVKGFDWEDAVDMGVFSSSVPTPTDENNGALHEADVIFYDPYSDYATKSQVNPVMWLNKELAVRVRSLFDMETSNA